MKPLTFTTVTTRAHSYFISCARRVHSTSLHPIYFRPILILSPLWALIFTGIITHDFPSKILYLSPPIRATCPAHLIILNLMNLMIFWGYKLWGSPLRSFLLSVPPLSPSVLDHWRWSGSAVVNKKQGRGCSGAVAGRGDTRWSRRSRTFFALASGSNAYQCSRPSGRKSRTRWQHLPTSGFISAGFSTNISTRLKLHRCTVLQGCDSVFTGVLEARTASFFTSEKWAKQITSKKNILTCAGEFIPDYTASYPTR